MHAATGIAESLGESRLDCRMTILVTPVQHEGACTEIRGKRIQLALQSDCFFSAYYADIRQPFDVRLAGGDVMQEEFAIQQHVVAGEKLHDLRVDLHAGFLPERLSHGDVLNGDANVVPSPVGAASAAPTRATLMALPSTTEWRCIRLHRWHG